MITIYTIAYNEEFFLPYMSKHYRDRFPQCEIVIHDNFSTDNTRQIAQQNHCQIIDFDTNNQINDNRYLDVKNNAWKSSKTDWVLVCDIDELLDIDQRYLTLEESSHTTIIQSMGYNMVNMEDHFSSFEELKYGAEAPSYNKNYLFNKKYIKEINYGHGCHVSNPIGNIKYSDIKYRAFHYKLVEFPYCWQRYQLFAKRLSNENLKHGWGQHYLQNEQQLRDDFKRWREKATLIR